MSTIEELPEVIFIPMFLATEAASSLFDVLRREVVWDQRIKARKTACFGQTYDVIASSLILIAPSGSMRTTI
jgi:hypothetical protein